MLMHLSRLQSKWKTLISSNEMVPSMGQTRRVSTQEEMHVDSKACQKHRKRRHLKYEIRGLA